VSRYARELDAQRQGHASVPVSLARPVASLPIDLTTNGLADRIARRQLAQGGVTDAPPSSAYQAAHGYSAATGRAAYATTAGNDAYVAGRDQYIIQAASPAVDDPTPTRRGRRGWITVTWGFGR
jgi:hypothetical protein